VLLTTTLVAASSPLLYGMPIMAAPAPGGSIILNKATGSFIDTDSSEKAIESNVVQVTVAEIAGIQITPVGVTGTPFLGNTIYFDFTVSNIGNDPTQFFIPSAPSAFTGGTPGTIQIISYDPDGTGPSASVPLSGVNVTAGGATGTLPNANTFNNGSIPAGGTITVRIPMTVTGSGNQPVSVTLGNTPAAPNDQNQTYIAGTEDLYTVDNSLLTNSDLVSGAPFNGVKEASAKLTATAIPNITGTVFEDVNYGGGAGRPFGTAGTIGVGATVELYKSDGTFVATTTTNSSGQYTFPNLTVNADYIVRVVNRTVRSSRPGTVPGLLPVQTFRTDAATGTALGVTDRVGGEKPSETDAPARSGTQILADLNALANQEAQSVTAVKVTNVDTTAVDFGYNFDTIVNTNATGQGSLDQFITNSNTLHDEASLAQTNQVSGKETSIFMISDGTAQPGLQAGLPNLLATSGANSGAAVIRPTLHYVISDSNTSLDGRTQSANIGQTNLGSPIGTGGTVGVDALTLDKVPRPEIVIDFSAVPVNTNGIQVTGANTLLAGLAVYGYHPFQNVAVTPLLGMIYVLPAVPDSGKTTITQLLVGTSADGTEPNIPLPRGAGIVTHGGTLITNNYIAYNGDGIYFANNNGTHATATNNEVTQNGPKDNSSNEASGDYADNIETDNNTTNFILRGNFVHDPSSPPSISANTQGQGIQISTGSKDGIVDNNTFDHNRRFGINSAGIDIAITKNIVRNTVSIPAAPSQGSGININDGMLRNLISQNSLYNNLTLGIDLSAGGVTPNDGTLNAAKANNGIDYPIVTASSLSAGGVLTVSGFVGKNPAGSPDFASATLEFFIAADDGNQNGSIFLGDGKSVPHGEGQTFLPPDGGSCKTDANSKFTCTFSTAGTLGLANARDITATTTDTAGNTSEFSGPAVNTPNVLLVKRITAIKVKGSSSFTPSTSYIDDPAYAYDDNTPTVPYPTTPSAPPEDTDKWPDPTLYLQGLIDGGAVKPGDEVEFTIYFLSTGITPAKGVALCDVLPKNMTFAADSFNGSSPIDVGSLGGENLGIAIANDATTLPSAPTTYLTNIGGDDQGQFIPPGSVPPTVCKDPSNSSIGLTAATNTTGAIYLQLRNDLLPATAQGVPTNSYGFVRFRARVN
jgi:trimeric autotransporter adhesin